MATNATIEKVVRKVVDDEMSESREATLKAIQQVRRLLTEQVIPNLPDESDQAEDEPEEETPVRGNGRSRAFSARAGKPGADPSDDPGIPEEDEDEPPTQAVPEAVTDALEDLYSGLSAEQAKSLAALFTAISEEPGSEEEEQEEEDEA
jgi:hypothetical protein